MTDQRTTLACNLGALTVEERTRRSIVAARVSARFREVRDTPDGYAARLDAADELIRDAVDWILLERRCCPFLSLELVFEPLPGAVWMKFGGGPGVKEFLGAAGLRAHARRAAPSIAE